MIYLIKRVNPQWLVCLSGGVPWMADAGRRDPEFCETDTGRQ